MGVGVVARVPAHRLRRGVGTVDDVAFRVAGSEAFGRGWADELRERTEVDDRVSGVCGERLGNWEWSDGIVLQDVDATIEGFGDALGRRERGIVDGVRIAARKRPVEDLLANPITDKELEPPEKFARPE